MKGNKGITLIALIITIIVLLILAIVSVNLIMNDNILKHANNAVTLYNEAQIDEQIQLNNVMEKMNIYNKTLSNENWWELTKEEEKEITYSSYGYMIADNGEYNNNYYIAVAFTEDKGLIEIRSDKTLENDKRLFFFISSNSKEEAEEMYNMQIEKYKWYIQDIENDIFQKYDGECPVSKEDFQVEGGTIYSETYLQKVINSFNK